MAIVTGPPVTGANFHNRVVEQTLFWRTIPGNHIILSDPRRIGKSSFLRRLVDNAPNHGFIANYIDVSKEPTIEAFFDRLIHEFPETSLKAQIKNLASAPGKWLSRVKKIELGVDAVGNAGVELKAATAPTWQKKAEKILGLLAKLPVIVVLDEFSVFIERLIQKDKDDAAIFLDTLRTWRSETLACRFVFSGSIGLNHLLELHNLTTKTNDCKDFRIGPFDESSAIKMLRDISKSEGWILEDTLALQMLQMLEWLSPFWIASLLDSVIDTAIAENSRQKPNLTTLTENHLNLGYAALIASREKFIYWDQRLDTHFTNALELGSVRNALTVLSKRPGGLKRTTFDAYLAGVAKPVEAFNLLCDHGYITQAKQLVNFQSPVLRAWWRNNH
jgi:uncharacterized protein